MAHHWWIKCKICSTAVICVKRGMLIVIGGRGMLSRGKGEWLKITSQSISSESETISFEAERSGYSR